ncbi:MAG: type IV conjugative transfer system protein TraE [Alphaproteobacteria bacterium]
MKFSLKQKRISSFSFQRNVLAGLSVVLLVVVVLQTVLLFFRSEKIIIHPPELKESYWVEGNRFAPSYLEEMAAYFAHLLLDVTETNFPYQSEIVLRFVDSERYGYFKTKFLEDLERIKRNNISTHFQLVETTIMPATLVVELSGELLGYVAGKKISQDRETYKVTFRERKGRLFLVGFDIVHSSKKEEVNHEDTHVEDNN